MTSHENEEALHRYQIDILKKGIAYLSNLTAHVRNDLSEIDGVGYPLESVKFATDLENEVIEQIEEGANNCGKLIGGWSKLKIGRPSAIMIVDFILNFSCRFNLNLMSTSVGGSINYNQLISTKRKQSTCFH